MSDRKTPLISLFFWGVAIAVSLALIFQNIQPLVTIYFLGKSTIPIPLSLTILVAFLIGGLGAFVINLISFWLNPKDRFVDRSEADEDESDEPVYTKPSPPKYAKPSPPKDDTVPYGANYEDDDFDDDDDVIDIKYINR